MEGVKLTISLIVAILLQITLRNVWEPLAFIDFPLIIVVYAALQRNSIRAILFGTIAGITTDALSGGLLGANGFTKTLIAYIISEIARRVYMDNLILRIPVLAGACLLNYLVYYGLHRLLGQTPSGDVLISGAYLLIGTTTVGTLIYAILQNFGTDKVRRKKREMFTPRRLTRRRNPIRLNK
jgi:rod shape-determining protein MreD